MKRIFIFLIFTTFIISRIFGQFDIKGKVFDSDGNSISGVTVTLNDGFKSTISDEYGFYDFENLEQKEYTLSIIYFGYHEEVHKISLTQNQIYNFHLIPSLLNELDQVVVNATRSNSKSPFVRTNIQKSEIDKNNIGQDIPYILKLTPSVVSTSDAGNGIGYTSMSIRGTDMTRINVTLNGIPLNDPESHGVWWVDVPDFASSVNSIQIQRGVGTSTNGAGAFGASINLKTNKLNQTPYAISSNSLGSFNTNKNTLSFGTGTINKHFSFDGRLSRQHSDGYIDRARADFKSYFLSTSFFNKKTLIKATIFSGLENTYQAWYGIPKDSLENNRTYNPYSYENEIDYYQQTHYQLHFVRKINDNLNFNASAFYIKGSGFYEQYKDAQDYSAYGLNPVIIENDTILQTDLIRQKWLDNDFFGLNYNLLYKKNNLNVVLGGSWNKYLGYHFGEIIWMQYAGNVPIRDEWYRNLGSKTDFNAYIKADYEFFDKLIVYADIQYRFINYQIKGSDDDLSDIEQSHQYPFYNPKFGLVFNFSDYQKIFTSVAIANREPKRTDYIDAPQDNIPLPEKLTDFELAYNFSNNYLNFQANIYYMIYKNQLILTGEINDVGTAIVTNTPESFRRGIELVLGTKIFKFIDWNANLTISQNKISDFVEYVDNWNYWDDPENNPLQINQNLGQTDIAFSPSIIASSMFSFKISKFLNIDFISKYVGRQFIDNTSSLERSLNPYFVNDVLLSTNFKTKYIKNINLSFKINNIFNEKYETNAWVYSYYYNNIKSSLFGYFPQANRNFLVNLSFKF